MNHSGPSPPIPLTLAISLFLPNADHDRVHLTERGNSPQMYNNRTHLFFCQLFHVAPLAAAEPGRLVL